MNKQLTLLFFLFISIITSAQKIDNLTSFRAIDNESYFRFNYENDYFAATDENYTQGYNFELVLKSLEKTLLTSSFLNLNFQTKNMVYL